MTSYCSTAATLCIAIISARNINFVPTLLSVALAVLVNLRFTASEAWQTQQQEQQRGGSRH
jgi:hypothetical protein